MKYPDPLLTTAYAPGYRAPIKPIETRHSGYRFRSRLEARWAVFFESLGVPYAYEPETFNLGGGKWYLPDFYLPDILLSLEAKDGTRGLYVEIKPDPNTAAPFWEQMNALSVASKRASTIIGVHTVTNYTDDVSEWPVYGSRALSEPGDHWHDIGPYLFCKCETCGQIGFEYQARSHRIPCVCDWSDDEGWQGWQGRCKAIDDAVEAARSERFGS